MYTKKLHCKAILSPFDVLHFAKSVMTPRLNKGDLAVDATAGNGHDTLFLSQQVGEQGLVLAFDVQKIALEATRNRLFESGTPDNVRLVHQGHENLAEQLLKLRREEREGGRTPRPLKAVMFNLGYLPGSDKHLVTQPATSVLAVRQALDTLDVGGICSIMLYTGHDGGEEEAEAVTHVVQGLDFQAFRCLRSELSNKPGSPIISLLVEKRRDQQPFSSGSA